MKSLKITKLINEKDSSEFDFIYDESFTANDDNYELFAITLQLLNQLRNDWVTSGYQVQGLEYQFVLRNYAVLINVSYQTDYRFMLYDRDKGKFINSDNPYRFFHQLLFHANGVNQ